MEKRDILIYIYINTQSKNMEKRNIYKKAYI